MKKVIVIGCGGAGKTTFSRQLGAILQLPIIHLDSHFWLPGWEAVPGEQWKKKVQGLIQQPAWIMDGNYGGTLDERISASDTIVFLDIGRFRCLHNVVRRRIKYAGTNRPELAEGNQERLSWSFILWIWTYRRTRRPGILQRLSKERVKKQVLIFHTYKEINAFLKKLESEN